MPVILASPHPLVFAGTDASGNINLWATDGTAAGTQELTSVVGASPASLSPQYFMTYNGEALFNGTDASGNNNLWTTDGTAAGTHEITGVTGASPSGLDPSGFTAYDGKLLFTGSNASGNYDLWITDGTAAGTHEVTATGASSSGLNPAYMTVYNGDALFEGEDSSNHYNLWVTDGTTAGTQELAVAGANAGGLYPNHLTAYNGNVLFDGFSAGGTYGLWTTDGTAAGTHEITGIQGAAATGQGLNPSEIKPYQGKLLFGGNDANGNDGLWVTDGTAGGTHEITVTGADATGGLNPGGFTEYNGKALFRGKDTSGNSGLWITDGTAAGTHEITVTGADASGGLAPGGFTQYDGRLLFNGTDASGNASIWITDGTSAGTHELTGVQGAAMSSGGLSPSEFTPLSLPGAAPTITSARAAADAAGVLSAGHLVTFTLTPSAALTIDTTYGSPTLTLNDGAVATFDMTASTSTSLVFRSTVAVGENTADLTVTSLTLNGAFIGEAGGTALDASGLAAAPGSETRLVIDTTVPPVTAAVTAVPGQASVDGQVLSGTGAPNASVAISENGSVVANVQAGADGRWTFDPSGLAPGMHSFIASETDAGGNAATTPAVAVNVPNPRFDVADMTVNTASSVIGSDYSGPVSYLQAQYGYSGSDNVVLQAKVANVFLHSGAGEDALGAVAGSNVLNGGTGSNWLVGASGADGGKDTFFVDGGNGQSTWDTLLNFHAGDMLTLWGYDGLSGSVSWSDSQGAAGYHGATLTARFGDAAGSNALITFASETMAGGQFATSAGSVGGMTYLAVTRM